jgi:hypothetical protein
MSNPPSSWTYWRDKKGFEAALDEYYPGLVKKNPLIATARMQIEIAKRAIDAEMRRLANEELEEEERD